MAREVVIRMTDDIDRTQEASEVETLGFRGFIYELDLTKEHSDELAQLLEPWLKAAHQKAKWPKRIKEEAVKRVAAKKAPATKSPLTKEQRQEVRQWGRDNGFEVAQRGFLATDLVKAWKKAARSRQRAS